ncbi:hypothetical protein SBV1_370002 [Verrucomicrobia bacterium]|nr:hypothetical protein SBV1_370002 [Verrucomicrobiota bacterium]
MKNDSSSSGARLRVAGMDMGPRCWFWCDEVRSPLVTACVWTELIASGNAPARVPQLMSALGISCILLDAGGEPDLGVGVCWDGTRGEWRNLRAAAVLFVAGAARGLVHSVGWTQEGRLYPLLKCNRSESIQLAVNDFLTPAQGVHEMVKTEPGSGAPQDDGKFETEDGSWDMDAPIVPHPAAVAPSGGTILRTEPRVRLLPSCAGPGVSQALLDSHLLNLRKERDPRTGLEDWVGGVENHLGLAKAYARLAQLVAHATSTPTKPGVPNLARYLNPLASGRFYHFK